MASSLVSSAVGAALVAERATLTVSRARSAQDHHRFARLHSVYLFCCSRLMRSALYACARLPVPDEHPRTPPAPRSPPPLQAAGAASGLAEGARQMSTEVLGTARHNFQYTFEVGEEGGAESGLQGAGRHWEGAGRGPGGGRCLHWMCQRPSQHPGGQGGAKGACNQYRCTSQMGLAGLLLLGQGLTHNCPLCPAAAKRDRHRGFPARQAGGRAQG